MAKESYKVILHVESDHEFIIEEANSEEEALIVAEQTFLDGDPGEIDNEEIVAWDVIPEAEVGTEE